MNPFWFLFRLAGMSFLAAAGTALLWKRYAPGTSDLVRGAMHFRNAFEEISKGLSVLAGGSFSSAEKPHKARESGRVVIE